MALLLPQVEELLSESSSSKHFVHNQKAFLDLFNLNLNDDKSVEKILRAINKLFTNASSRAAGFTYLNSIIQHCPTQLLVENCVRWIKTCIPQETNQTISYEQLCVIENLLESCGEIPDFTKAITSGLLPKLIDILLTNLTANRSLETSLVCLILCLKKYPSTCLPMKNKTEVILCKFLESELPDSILKNVGCAYHYLQQVGGAGPEGINHINNWSKQLKKLCVTVHSLYDTLLENITEYKGYGTNDEPLKFTEIPSTTGTVEAMCITSRRLKNVLIFINSFLIKQFPVAKHVPVQEILDIIKRGISADCFKKIENSEDLHLAALLYQNQVQLLLLLRSLVACLKQNILLYSFIITKILADCVYRSQSYEYFTNKSDFQLTLYKVFSYWISLAKAGGTLLINDKLIEAMIQDITPIKNALVLNISTEFAKKSSKLKQKVMQEQLESMANARSRNLTGNLKCSKELITLEVIKTLKNLCTFTTLNLKTQTITKLYQTVIDILLEIQEGKITDPYHNLKCQLALYELLLSFFEQKHSTPLPPLYVALNILKTGQMDKNYLISQLCFVASRTLEHLCQPVCSTLYIGNTNTTDSEKEAVVTSNFFVEEKEELHRETYFESPFQKEVNETLDSPLNDHIHKIKILSVDIVKPADVNFESLQATEKVQSINMENDKGSERLTVEESIEMDSDFSLCIEVSDSTEPPCKKLKSEDDDVLDNSKSERDQQVTTSNEKNAADGENKSQDDTCEDLENEEEDEMLKSFVDDVSDDV